MQAFEQLHAAATQILSRAYAPYSNHPVAAAALDAAGTIHTGINIENASFGLTQCAEGSMIAAWRLAAGPVTLAELLPAAFGPHNLQD